MYNVGNKSECFYKQNLVKEEVFGPFDREKFLQGVYNDLANESKVPELLNVHYNCHKWNYSGSDSGRWVDFGNYEIRSYQIRPILYFDGEGRILDPRNFVKEAIQKSYGNEKIKKPVSSFNSCLFSAYFLRRNIPYKFRCDPVPGTGRYRGRHRTNRGKKGLKRILTQSADPEYKEYVRKKAMPFTDFDLYDLDGNVWNKHDSWKNHKIRKQWMKNL